MRALLTSLATAAALCCAVSFAPSASAATVFGDTLTLNPTPNSQFITLVTARNPDGTEYEGSPVSGVITSLRLRSSGNAGEVNVLVERRLGPLGTPVDYMKVGEQLFTVPADPTGVNTEMATRIAVQAGDVLGVDMPNGINTTISYMASVDICVWRSTFSPEQQAVGATAEFSLAACNTWWPAVQATVEADADGDGYGDETQDFCPANADRQDACPPPPGDPGSTAPPGPLYNTIDLGITPIKAPHPKVGKAAIRSFVVRNHNTVGRAQGVLLTAPSVRNIKSVKFLSGCRPYPRKPRVCEIASLAPGEAATVRLRATAKKSGRFALPVRVSYGGPDGDLANNKASPKVRFLVP